MAGTADLARQAQEARQMQERDAADLREQLLKVVRQTDALNNLLTDTKDVERIMQTLQEVRISKCRKSTSITYQETRKYNRNRRHLPVVLIVIAIVISRI